MRKTLDDLTRKEAELVRLLESYERKKNLLETELSQTRAVIDLHKKAIAGSTYLPHISLRRLFKPYELRATCLEALRDAGRPLDTRELAVAAIQKQGLDPEDVAIRKKVVFSVQSAMKSAVNAKLARREGKQNGVCLWSS